MTHPLTCSMNTLVGAVASVAFLLPGAICSNLKTLLTPDPLSTSMPAILARHRMILPSSTRSLSPASCLSIADSDSAENCFSSEGSKDAIQADADTDTDTESRGTGRESSFLELDQVTKTKSSLLRFVCFDASFVFSPLKCLLLFLLSQPR